MPTIIRRVSFSSQNTPFIEYSDGERVWQVDPFEQNISLQFAMDKRFCIGGYDIETGENYACPYEAVVSDKYEQCVACMKTTGFNPAFYHATSVSKQQLARNAQPHIVYLAYFGSDVIKVGISYAKRGLGRLLEQGARAAMILLECQSATIARGYEERITGKYGIRDHVQLGKKTELAKQTFSPEQAEQALRGVAVDLQRDLQVTFDRMDITVCDPYYFTRGVTPDLSQAIDLTSLHAIAGTTRGMIGSVLYCHYDGRIVYIPLKKYIGYAVSEAVLPLDLGAQQMTLF